MRSTLSVTVLVAACSLAAASMAQEKSLASTIGVYVFPSNGQDTSQQSKDESACYQWAVDNTGTDAFDLMKQADSNVAQAEQQSQAAQQVGKGAGARGAFGGAAAGAVIGEIASDDAGGGAAWGAALGAIGARRRAREAREQAEEQADAQAVAGVAEPAAKLDDFKKAFSVCLEAKKYMVKY